MALPPTIAVPLELASELRYGENPHQPAALYRKRGSAPWWASAEQLQGKAMSFNNYNDTEAAWRLANDLASPGVVVVKHANPSGAAEAESLSAAFRAAWDCDPVSAFGGIVALNGPVDADTASMIVEYFTEVVIAPGIADDAIEILATKKNLRVLVAPPPDRGGIELRPVDGGALAQVRDVPGGLDGWPDDWSVASERAPTEEEMQNLRFAWIVAAHTKSNAVVVAKDRAAVGVGAGDQSRVGAAERALVRAGDRSVGAVAASDAFFPFSDGLEVLAGAGVTAVIEPGGSMRDDEVIAAADAAGVAVVFTHRRHFRH
jgi:phosphoribosylaminoimidazolecarboxamide formyltransferase/IMP cyclohydrolase